MREAIATAAGAGGRGQPVRRRQGRQGPDRAVHARRSAGPSTAAGVAVALRGRDRRRWSSTRAIPTRRRRRSRRSRPDADGATRRAPRRGWRGSCSASALAWPGAEHRWLKATAILPGEAPRGREAAPRPRPRRAAAPRAGRGDAARRARAAIGEARMVERTIVVSGEPAAQQSPSTTAPRWSPTPTTPAIPRRRCRHRPPCRGRLLRRAAPRRLPAARPARARQPADRRARALRRRRPRPPRHRHQRARCSRPPDAIRPAFGEGSCERHVAGGARGGHPARASSSCPRWPSTSTPRPT